MYGYILVTSCVCVRYILDEPLKLLCIIWAAVISCPSVTDGEFVELQHIHHPHLCHSTAIQVWTLIHTRRCVCISNLCYRLNLLTNIHSHTQIEYIPFTSHCRTQSLLNGHLHSKKEGMSWVCVMPYGSQPLVSDVTKHCLMCCLMTKLIEAKQLTTVRWIWR